MRSMLRGVSARLVELNFAFLNSYSGRIVVKAPARKMASYSTVERGSPFSLDYRVYLSKLKQLQERAHMMWVCLLRRCLIVMTHSPAFWRQLQVPVDWRHHLSSLSYFSGISFFTGASPRRRIEHVQYRTTAFVYVASSFEFFSISLRLLQPLQHHLPQNQNARLFCFFAGIICRRSVS